MPAKSKKQQMAAGAALAAKRGKRSKSSLYGASRSMYKSMSKAELRRMAKTNRKGKPTRKRKKRYGSLRRFYRSRSDERRMQVKGNGARLSLGRGRSPKCPRKTVLRPRRVATASVIFPA